VGVHIFFCAGLSGDKGRKGKVHVSKVGLELLKAKLGYPLKKQLHMVGDGTNNY